MGLSKEAKHLLLRWTLMRSFGNTEGFTYHLPITCCHCRTIRSSTLPSLVFVHQLADYKMTSQHIPKPHPIRFDGAYMWPGMIISYVELDFIVDMFYIYIYKYTHTYIYTHVYVVRYDMHVDLHIDPLVPCKYQYIYIYTYTLLAI